MCIYVYNCMILSNSYRYSCGRSSRRKCNRIYQSSHRGTCKACPPLSPYWCSEADSSPLHRRLAQMELTPALSRRRRYTASFTSLFRCLRTTLSSFPRSFPSLTILSSLEKRGG